MNRFDVLNVGGCGVAVVGGLYGGPNAQAMQIGDKYVKGTFKDVVLAGHKKIWTSYPNVPYPGACCIWADIDTPTSNGELIYKDLLAQGEIVDKLECGTNPIHGTAKIVVYFWYTTPEGRKLHPKATIRKIELGQEEKPATAVKEPVKQASSPTEPKPRVHKLGRVAGAGVRAFRYGKPGRVV